MNDYAKRQLQNAVLEHRVKLREAREEIETRAEQLQLAVTVYRMWCDRILDLQRACGNVIDIDPTNSDIAEFIVNLHANLAKQLI
jgi:hypothetical protein